VRSRAAMWIVRRLGLASLQEIKKKRRGDLSTEYNGTRESEQTAAPCNGVVARIHSLQPPATLGGRLVWPSFFLFAMSFDERISGDRYRHRKDHSFPPTSLRLSRNLHFCVPEAEAKAPALRKRPPAPCVQRRRLCAPDVQARGSVRTPVRGAWRESSGGRTPIFCYSNYTNELPAGADSRQRVTMLRSATCRSVSTNQRSKSTLLPKNLQQTSILV